MPANQSPPPDQNPSLLLPVGHYGGAFRDTEPGGDAVRHEVRRGGELIALSEPTFKVWALSHRPPEWPADRPWTRQSMLDRARLVGLDNADDLVSDLLGERLLVELRPGANAVREVAAGIHMHPTMLGLGNTAEDANVFALGFVGTPLVQVSRTVFELWRWAPVEHDLWSLCRFFARMEREHGTTDPERTDPDVVLTGLVTSLPALLSSGAVYLDLAE